MVVRTLLCVAIVLFSLASFGGPAHQAARAGNWHIVWEMLARGLANIDELDNGETLLDIAITSDHDKAARELVRLGARFRMPQRIGMFEGGSQAVVEVLPLEPFSHLSGLSSLSTQTEIFIDYLTMASRCTGDNCHKLRSKAIFDLMGSIDINLAVRGVTPLIAAMNENFEPTFLALLQRGADPNLADEAGQRPLALAIAKGMEFAAWILFEAGAACTAQEARLISSKGDILETLRFTDLVKDLGDKLEGVLWQERVSMFMRKMHLVRSTHTLRTLRHFYLMLHNPLEKEAALKLFTTLLDSRYLHNVQGGLSKEVLQHELESIQYQLFPNDVDLVTLHSFFSSYLTRTMPSHELVRANVEPIQRVQMVEEEPEPEVASFGACAICTEEEVELLSLGCKKHKYCEACQRHYFEERVGLRDTRIKCMEPGCGTVLDDEAILRLLPKVQAKKHQDTVLAKERRDREISEGASRCYLFKELMKGSLRCLLGGGFCPTGGFCYFCDCLPVEIEHCPWCHTTIEYNGGCPHITCRNCGWAYVRDQQCNIPGYCCTAGCYCPAPLWLTCGIFLCLGHGFTCTPFLPCFWVKKL